MKRNDSNIIMIPEEKFTKVPGVSLLQLDTLSGTITQVRQLSIVGLSIGWPKNRFSIDKEAIPQGSQGQV